MAFPTALALWTALGGLTAYRTLVRPSRGVFDEGSVESCPGGPGCDAAMLIVSARGVSRVYALVRGIVTRVEGHRVELAGSLEPVILDYSGPDFRPLVSAGSRVLPGQVIGEGSGVNFAVSEIQRAATGGVLAFPLEPATFLAARGLKAASRLAPSALWCAQGRKLVVPQAAGQCGLRLPDPSGFSLLPVSARLE